MPKPTAQQLLAAGLHEIGALEFTSPQPLGWRKFQHSPGKFFWLATDGRMRIGTSPSESFDFTGSNFYSQMLTKGRASLAESGALVVTLEDLGL